jgi:cysteine desulfurase family protein (TIGR01976 family)
MTLPAHAAAPTVTDLDVAAVRPQFPGLARSMPDGRPAVFFDGPGGSQPHASAIAAVTRHLEASMANLDGAFATARETTATVERARLAAADLLGATPEEIAFGPNMTTLNFLLAHALARTLAAGDEIVVTALDHDANVAPWLLVARDHGLVVRTAPLRVTDGTLDTGALERLLGPRTRVVAFPLASNALGTVPEIGRIAAAAHRAGALAWCDAVHFAPHRRIDVAALGLDVVLCSAYKFFGPHVGVAAIRRDLAEALPADQVRPASDQPPGHRFETGTQSHEGLAGMVAAVDYLAGLGAGGTRRERLDDAFARIQRYEAALTLRFLDGVAGLPKLRLYGIADPARVGERTPTLCFTIEGQPPRAVTEALGEAGIFTWHGNYYALNVMESLGLEGRGGAVRAGFLHYNTAVEVDRLLEALHPIAS